MNRITSNDTQMSLIYTHTWTSTHAHTKTHQKVEIKKTQDKKKCLHTY